MAEVALQVRHFALCGDERPQPNARSSGRHLEQSNYTATLLYDDVAALALSFASSHAGVERASGSNSARAAGFGLSTRRAVRPVCSKVARESWSGRRESNPRMQLGKLPFYH